MSVQGSEVAAVVSAALLDVTTAVDGVALALVVVSPVVAAGSVGTDP